MADDFQEKTEEATPKKLQDARKKGQVARSQDFTTSFVLFVGMTVLAFTGNFIFERVRRLSEAIFTHLDLSYGTLEDVAFWGERAIQFIFVTLFPMFVGVLIAALSVNVLQVGFLISTEPLTPKGKNLNIFNPSNYKKFFNVQALMRLVMGLSKIAVVGVVCYFVILGSLNDLSRLMMGEVDDMFYFLVWYGFLIGFLTAVILIVLGIIDFIYQRWKFSNDQKMSKQDIKDEHKQAEGDAQIKGRMRSMMQSFSQSRMKERVPESDVVIANPIHFAIAIKYDPEKIAAPFVVAKGARKMALIIKDLAKEHNVPIVENPPLAQALYKAVEVGTVIPPQFYHAIAEVLAYVYRLNQELEGVFEKKGFTPQAKDPQSLV
ncbi:MAG: flagellar biosynthesis protein FlhB [Waddliaceae bacterium]|nr:flagellar biosynthesis protein FlhB [Waddliaceae bacterium]